MKLILLRHGQTQWNMARKLQGWRDSQLTPQAKRRLAALPGAKLQNAVIYSSDLGRAQATARIAANITGSHIVTDWRLRERCFGILEGKNIIDHEAGGAHWQAYHQRYRTPMADVPGVESELQLEQRIMSWLDEVGEKYKGRNVLVVSHGEWLRALRNIISGTPSWHQGAGITSNGEPAVISFV
ncbi:histidine phosphatase family protein [Photobacterium sagamiensis]|uniref:histidine phosphatase family protein n=1 Tax=Photobacterium sagamiensis TaxID=2910241 RepID=UPI003D105ECB